MKRLLLVVALTGLMSVTVLAGNIPTNDSPSPTSTQSTTVLPGNMPTGGAVAGEIPTNDAPPPAPPTTTSTLLANVVFAIITLIGH